MPSRKGLMVALDLEHYSYEKGSKTFMRATEGTILARLPPRVRVREAASVELPHIMVLIDDPDRTVIEPLFAKKDSLKCAYDFDLMCNGGHLKGWSVDGADDIAQVHPAPQVNTTTGHLTQHLSEWFGLPLPHVLQSALMYGRRQRMCYLEGKGVRLRRCLAALSS